MSGKTHFEKVVSYVMSNDKSELTNMTAERDYALHCLEREIAIAHQMQAENGRLRRALRDVMNAENCPYEVARDALRCDRTTPEKSHD